MYTVLLALALGLATFGLAAATLSPVAGIVPGLLVSGVAMFFLSRRVTRRLEGEMMSLAPLLQGGKVDEVKVRLEEIRRRYRRWQLLLDGQIDAQLGMLDYLRLKWDDATPLLERGKFRNWQAQVCLGAIHFRQGRAEKAWPLFASAANLAPKEAIVYLVWAVLLVRAGERNQALEALDKGLKALPESDTLRRLQKTIANKKKVDTRKFPEVWFQFFPEDLLAGQRMRGTRAGPSPGLVVQQPRIGARGAPRR